MQLLRPECPRCREKLRRNGETLNCSGCGIIYPRNSGVIDFLTPLSLAKELTGICDYFDNSSANYDSMIVTMVEELKCPWREYSELIERVVIEARKKLIVDLGCGTSFPVGSFIPGDSHYLGLDISSEMLKQSHSLFEDDSNTSLWRIDVEHLPLPDNSADLCLAFFSFNVFINLEKTIRQVNRVLKADGELFGNIALTLPQENSLQPFRSISAQQLKELLTGLDRLGRELVTERKGDILFFHLKQATVLL
ncbi:MAG TPA: class I SAM-dependent methyltransferase [Spirochaetales bacterium]|nr:class I SAM-dependent methyltransferase [Spirochaetales bacterium]